MAFRVVLLLSTIFAFGSTWKGAKHDVLEDPSSISAKPGEKVQLSCVLRSFTKPLSLNDFMMRWIVNGQEVADFDNKITINKPGLSMSLDAIKNGDATLTIESFSPDHAGHYFCYIYYYADVSMKDVVLSAA